MGDDAAGGHPLEADVAGVVGGLPDLARGEFGERCDVCGGDGAAAVEIHEAAGAVVEIAEHWQHFIDGAGEPGRHGLLRFDEGALHGHECAQRIGDGGWAAAGVAAVGQDRCGERVLQRGEAGSAHACEALAADTRERQRGR